MNAFAALRLTLPPEDLTEIRRVLADRLREGAACEGRELAMLPAWLAPPRAGLRGEAIAIDAGGTSLRAARIAAGEGGGARIVGQIHEEPLPGAAGRPEATAGGFFAAHARLVKRLDAPAGLPIGYCFSYPSAVRPDGDAVLLRWTKEVRVPGVEGRQVGALLTEHLREHGVVPGPVFVLNDTIATLAAGSRGPGTLVPNSGNGNGDGADGRSGPAPVRSVGLIVGTGSNIGAYLPVALLRKLAVPWWPSDFMAVNFESGAFAPPGLGPVDDAIDTASIDPGRQRLEKAVSGAYLGRLFTSAAARLGLDLPLRLRLPHAAVESTEVSRLAAEDAGSPGGILARALLDRSADLVAAALAATSDVIEGAGDLQVCAEGSLIVKGSGYAARVSATLDRMLAGGERAGRARLTFGRDANLIGSALAALAHRSR